MSAAKDPFHERMAVAVKAETPNSTLHLIELVGDDGELDLLEFVGYGHASLIQREGVQKRGTVHTTITDEPCDCDDSHVELWAIREHWEVR